MGQHVHNDAGQRPTAGSSVTLGSNNARLTVPGTVTVAAGATTATFNATAAASITSNQSATLTATLGTSSKTATISLVAPGLLSTLACIPTSLGQSAVGICTVTLAQTAPTGGSNVTLASNNASLTVLASVTVASGATTAIFIVTAAASIASNQTATVTATIGTSSSDSNDQSGKAPGLISTLACNPTSLGQGAVSTCTVTMAPAAPAGLERDPGQQQRCARRTGIGDGGFGGYDGHFQRDGGGFDHKQSERVNEGDTWHEFENGDNQSAGDGIAIHSGVQSQQPGAECGGHLHGDADRSHGRLKRDPGQQRCFADRTGIGHAGLGSDNGDVQRDNGSYNRKQPERDSNGDPRQQFEGR